ncbi:MAG: tyrosine-type recombinase/integrase [Pseudonocardia sp.]
MPAVQRRDQRQRGQIRQRGGSFLVSVYAGVDPLTGKRIYLNESASTQAAAKKLLTKLCAQVDEQRHARTRTPLSEALGSWLRTHEAEATTLDGYRGYIERTIEPALGSVPVSTVTVRLLEEFYADLRRCRKRCRGGEPAVDHRTAAPHECREVRHRRRPGRPARVEPPHDCATAGCTVIECPPHQCKPMSASAILQIHWIINSALGSAVRWGWITTNPAESAKKPRRKPPQPEPPTAAEAARIIEAAWAEDDSWGTLVWLVMVTGVRRAELAGLRWRHIDLDIGTVKISRNWLRSGGEDIDKDTKTHQSRTLALDGATVEVLAEHRERYRRQMGELGLEPTEDAFVFSARPTHDRPYSPSRVTHRYSDMCAGLDIDSHLHALRHYSATELLTAGVDLRTVAGRLGHGGGGATTLRVYAAFVGEADRRAAEILGSRMKRPNTPVD